MTVNELKTAVINRNTVKLLEPDNGTYVVSLNQKHLVTSANYQEASDFFRLVVNALLEGY